MKSLNAAVTVSISIALNERIYEILGNANLSARQHAYVISINYIKMTSEKSCV